LAEQQLARSALDGAVRADDGLQLRNTRAELRNDPVHPVESAIGDIDAEVPTYYES
jgi:hypothetical protein